MLSLAGIARADDVPETVTVTGEKYSLQQSINIKRNTDIVSDSISADEIGAIPEFGIGDALRKVPGVSLQINNGRGEDQFITVRGLNPDYGTTTVDGMALATTEESTRWVSLDVLASVIVRQIDVDKTWRVDQPSDAVAGIVNLHTRSAFDNPGQFFEAHVDGAYWFDHEVVHSEEPSGQADATFSKTFGPNDEFGILLLGTYFQRSSSTLNTYTLPWSYYTAAGKLDVSSSSIAPNQSIAGDIPIPDRHRWYFYDNDRYRPGAFARFDFDDHSMFHAHLDGGFFQFINNEHRYSQYLNKGSNSVTTILTPTTGGFSTGSGEDDYDKYVQNRFVEFVELGGGVKFDEDTHLDVTFNYSIGHYDQTTAEDQFTTPSGTPNLAYTYNLAAPTAPLFTPNTLAYFMNPANYTEVYHLNALDTSTNELPQTRVEFDKDFGGGINLRAGWVWRDMTQHYLYNQFRLNPNKGTAPTLAAAGFINTFVPLYDGEGQTLLLVDRNAVDQYVAANLANYTENASDLLSNTVNNYHLSEEINAEYVEANYRWENLYALVGLRFETTNEKIENYLPSPFSSTTNFQLVDTSANYSKLLPSLNLAYDVTDALKLRGAVTETLARAEYAQLAENSSATVSGNQASESISNPNLKPRKSANFDLSAEWHWASDALASVAVFNKQIQNEIVTLTNQYSNATVAGCTAPCTLTITTPENAGSGIIQGVELNLAAVKFDFLPGFLSDFGADANVSFMTFDSPDIRMKDGSFRQLPQLLYASRTVENFTLLYSRGPYSGEITYNYTAKMPISFDTSNKVNDQWWRGISTVDAQAKYQFNDHWFLRIQGKNIFDARPQKVVGLTQQLNYSTLENGAAVYVGVGVVF